MLASIPGFSRFYLLFVFTIIHGRRRAVKNGESLGSFIVWMTSDKVDVRGRGPTALDHGQAVYSSSRLQMLAWSILLVFTSNKVTLELNLCILECRLLPSPPTSTSHPLTWWVSPGLPRFPLLFCFHILETEEQKKNEGVLGMRLIVYYTRLED